ncbi:MAG: tyrosine-type recombinase/integrase [Pseudomonadota bacterium]
MAALALEHTDNPLLQSQHYLRCARIQHEISMSGSGSERLFAALFGNGRYGKTALLSGQKRPLLPKPARAIRARLELAGYLRDLLLFDVAIDSKLRGCYLVKLAVADLVKDGRVRERVSKIQSKTKKPVQFELTENTRDTVIAWVGSPETIRCRFAFPSRFHDRLNISTRQCGRLVRDRVTAIGLEPGGYGTHSMRRTKAAEIYRKTGNLRAVQLLLGHTKLDRTVRYLGVELEDALSIAERIDI